MKWELIVFVMIKDPVIKGDVWQIQTMRSEFDDNRLFSLAQLCELVFTQAKAKYGDKFDHIVSFKFTPQKEMPSNSNIQPTIIGKIGPGKKPT